MKSLEELQEIRNRALNQINLRKERENGINSIRIVQ